MVCTSQYDATTPHGRMIWGKGASKGHESDLFRESRIVHTDERPELVDDGDKVAKVDHERERFDLEALPHLSQSGQQT
eukprot:759767-Hanusia_phi.AAC.5